MFPRIQHLTEVWVNVYQPVSDISILPTQFSVNMEAVVGMLIRANNFTRFLLKPFSCQYFKSSDWSAVSEPREIVLNGNNIKSI